MKSNRVFLLAAAGLVVAGLTAVWAFNAGWFAGGGGVSRVEQKEAERKAEQQAAELASIPNSKEALAKSLGIPEDELVMVGGVWRPKRDLESAASQEAPNGVTSAASVKEFVSPFRSAGIAPRLKGDENPQVAGMFAEMQGTAANQQETDLTESDNADRGDQRVVSTWESREEFDLQAYQENPETYLNQIRPARVFDPAQPGQGVVPLSSDSPAFQNVLQGEQVVLEVKADAGMPVAFYTPQTGSFVENDLTSLTVRANDQGVARATYRTGPGLVGLTDVLAASPVHSGQLRFRVNVGLPRQTGEQN